MFSRIINNEGWPIPGKSCYGFAGYHQEFKFLNVIYTIKSTNDTIYFEKYQLINRFSRIL